MTPTTIAIVILVVAAVATVILLIVNASRGRRLIEDVPPGQRPAYSDQELETTVLERHMAWGVVLTLFFAIFLPVYWLREPTRQSAKVEEEFIDAVVAGEALFQANCALCHGATLAGGGAKSPYDPDDSWPAPALNNIVARYEPSETIADVRQHIITTIMRGRPGTPMAAWGAEFAGPLTDQQVFNLTDYILSQQTGEVAEPAAAIGVSGEELYQANCARCHGEDLGGVVGPSLIGVFERHNEESILGILRNGVMLNGAIMPPWQIGYQHEPYTDEALRRIVDYLRERQPEVLPENAGQYQSPGVVGEDFSDDDYQSELEGPGQDGGTEPPAADATEA